MRLLAIVHQPDAGPGVFLDTIRGRGAELHCWQPPEEGPLGCDPHDYDAVLTFGGAAHPDSEAQHPWLAEEKALLGELLQRGVPLLGVCLGAELLAEAACAPARRSIEPEIGWYTVERSEEASRDPLIGPLGPRFEALEWHSYECSPPAAATPLARSESCLQAYRLGETAWGIQFHAEVTLEDFERWVEDYRSDEAAVRIGANPSELLAGTRKRISTWNALGRGLCERFLAVADAGR